MVASKFSTRVVGLTFVDGYPQNVRALEAAMFRCSIAEGDDTLGIARRDARSAEGLARHMPDVVLVRRPTNAHDRNAIEVRLGDEHGPMLGHLGAGVAANLAAELDAGVPWRAEIEQVLVDDRGPDNPGVALRLERAP